MRARLKQLAASALVLVLAAADPVSAAASAKSGPRAAANRIAPLPPAAPLTAPMRAFSMQTAAPVAAGPALAATMGTRQAQVLEVTAELAQPRNGEHVHDLGRRLAGEAGASPAPVALTAAPIGAAPALEPARLLRPRQLAAVRGASSDRTRPNARSRSRLSGGAFMLAAASLPLNAWPVIIWFAAPVAVFGAVLTLDLWAGGALTRRLAWSLQRRRQLVQNGLAEDAAQLLPVREVDEPKLKDFLNAWSQAPRDGREPLIAAAVEDAELWRQKLALAFMADADPTTQERLLAAMGRASRRHLRSMSPVVLQMLSQRGKLPWLEHVDAARALSLLAQAWVKPSDEPSKRALESLAAHPEQSVSAPARGALGNLAPRPARQGLGKRLKLGTVALLTAAALMMTGVSGVKIAEYSAAKQETLVASSEIFYGNDSFIFSDHYLDERIPRFVLPAMRRWSADTESGRAELERAIKILSESADPKADNLLETTLRYSNTLPLSADAEQTLLLTLVERDNDRVWSSLPGLLETARDKPQMLARLKRMIGVAMRLDTPRSFQNVFHLLKSPDAALRNAASTAIYKSLTQPSRVDEFYARLGAAQKRFATAADPELNLWIEKFLLRRTATAPISEIDAKKTSDLLLTIFNSLMAHDANRSNILAAAAKSNQKAPETPSMTAAGLSLFDEALAFSAKQADSTPGEPSPTLVSLAKLQIGRAVTRLIEESERIFPGMHDKLIELEVVLPDFDRKALEFAYQQDARWKGGLLESRFLYPSSGLKGYREHYKQMHLRLLGAEIATRAGGQATATAQEIALRAAETLGQMEKTGKAAGVLYGDTPAEKAAAEINAMLAEGFETIDPEKLLKDLRDLGLAPNNGLTEGEGAYYREAYTLEQLRRLSDYFKSIALRADAHEREYSLSARQRIQELMSKHFGRSRAAP